VHVESELLALERVFGASLGTCRVLATVSHRHVYGLLFRVLWPLLARRPFATFDLAFPEHLLGEAGEGGALVASPALLKRIGHLPAGSGRWRAVFSSGGTLPSDAAEAAARTLGVRPIEVLGSTETSGVAWRAAGAAAFTPLPSVEVRSSADELLEVRSPFSGDEGWVRTGDRVRFDANGGIELLGRADRVAKIEDKRVSLAEIERCLREHAWIRDAAAVALDDSKRQYVGVVVELTPEGRGALAERGRRALRTELVRALRGRIDNVALPRAFRYCAAIPTDAQGKRQAALLAALFSRR
jgi:acyl-coenzyme A synthetase/AMP-(fatty) acid ligase